MFLEKFKELLAFQGLNYNDFSVKANIPRTTVSGWVNSGRLPDYNALIKIADFFDITIDELVGREQKQSAEVKQDNQITELINAYKKLSNRQKKHIRISMYSLANDQEKLEREIKVITD